MNSLNSILLEGNLTRDPESKQTSKGTSLCTFSVASNRFFRMGESVQKEVSYFDVETWSSLADRCSGELKKGRGVRVIGHLKQERWTDTEGQNRSKIKIIADHVEFRPVKEKDSNEDDADLATTETSSASEAVSSDAEPVEMAI